MVAEFTKPIGNQIFKIIKKNTPGPFTFILEASQKIQKFSKNNKKTLGVRISDNKIVRAIVHELGHPIVTTSVIDEDDIVEYTTDPSLIAERFENQVDLVIDGGYGNSEPSTLVDCSDGEIVVIRDGVRPLIY
jgi:tRNA threonylcarbamoyl adenosine modification protein (Sua5/YciO/YrdC/YwlC family)